MIIINNVHLSERIPASRTIRPMASECFLCVPFHSPSFFVNCSLIGLQSCRVEMTWRRMELIDGAPAIDSSHSLSQPVSPGPMHIHIANICFAPFFKIFKIHKLLMELDLEWEYCGAILESYQLDWLTRGVCIGTTRAICFLMEFAIDQGSNWNGLECKYQCE